MFQGIPRMIIQIYLMSKVMIFLAMHNFFILNSESEDDSGDLNYARQWKKLSSVPETISASPSQFPFIGTPGMAPNILWSK